MSPALYTTRWAGPEQVMFSLFFITNDLLLTFFDCLNIGCEHCLEVGLTN